jgi:hypothetical protein
MDITLDPTGYLNKSLYGNIALSTIMLKMAIFISFIGMWLDSPITVVFAVSCIAPALANQLLITYLNLQLRTVLQNVSRTRIELNAELDKLLPNDYNFGKSANQKLSAYVNSVIYITYITDIILTVLLMLSVMSLVYNLMAITKIAMIIYGSLCPVVYAVYYLQRDWYNNSDGRISWKYK